MSDREFIADLARKNGKLGSALAEARVMLDVIDARHQPLENQELLMPGEPEPCCGGCFATWPCPDHLTMHPGDDS